MVIRHSVYCLEFDSTRIITGSRDRTIKVWSLATGRLLGTFWGVHRGSVLCLKFEGDWEEGEGEGGGEDSSEGCTDVIGGVDREGVEVMGGSGVGGWNGRGKGKRGFMVSGSSDCSVCVWDLYAVRGGGGRDRHSFSGMVDVEGDDEAYEGEEEGEVHAEVRAVLKGHSGGVLDLRIDKKWIVSWCVCVSLRSFACISASMTSCALLGFLRCAEPGYRGMVGWHLLMTWFVITARKTPLSVYGTGPPSISIGRCEATKAP